ncbi:MAG TPA: hypothetical protein VKV39_09365 [Candidatus Sulfotelmatobacter sp.]|nr:hypothetical protein [Candidatus Sulfotelmatobacter sp.]
MRNIRFVKSVIAIANVAALTLSMACSINVKKEPNGQDKQVDIQTPVGGIHVSKAAEPEDVGLPVYPGSRIKEKGSGDDKSANVRISGFGFGLRVVALQYQSDDSPAKLVSFYHDQLGKYGQVLVCHSSGHFQVKSEPKDSNHGSRELTCDGSSGENTELKVGTEDNQHIVAIEPDGKGSSFSLVYVHTHGKEAEI